MSSMSPVATPSDSFGRVRAWSAVLLLMVVTVVNAVDRMLPGILIEPVKHDLLLSDTTLGLINGFGFLVVYSLMAIPLARLADRGLFGLVVSGCLGLWSVMTALGSFAANGWQFALSRMGVALGEAGGTPAAHAFIARNFAPTARAAPLAVLSLALPLSVVAGTYGGAMLGAALGWRGAFFTMGLAGLLLSPVALMILGPRQTIAASVESSSWGPTLQLLRNPSFLIILAAAALVGIGGYTLGTFSAAFLMRVHGLALVDVGMRYGLASGAAGAAGLLIVGALADRLSSRDPRWSLWVLALMIAVTLPFTYGAFLVKDATTALALMALSHIVGTAYLAPVIAAIQRLAPARSRATASAILLLCQSLAGGVGPLLTGMISDALRPQLGDAALGPAMLVAPAAYTIAGGLFVIAAVRYRRDIIPQDAVMA